MNFGNPFPPLECSDCIPLDQPVSNDENKEALFTIGALKALGIDRFHAFFNQNQRSVVGDSLCLMVRDVFEGVICHMRLIPPALCIFRKLIILKI